MASAQNHPWTRLLHGTATVLALAVTGCSTPFPKAPQNPGPQAQAEAQAIFDRCLAAHGGDFRTHTKDINLSLEGEWSAMIQRIQPIVTDAAFRITAQERFRPADQLYTVEWQGPAGTKKVVRTSDAIEVYYNGVRETDDKKLRATAMTADAFQLFHLGPSFLQLRGAKFTRLEDAREKGVTYQRLLTTIRPGFGFSPADDVVVWIDPKTHRLFRVHMTLNGFETTQGAHVDTTFLEYRQVGPVLVPVLLDERVRGPIGIHAHRWRMTGADVDRGWTAGEVNGSTWNGTAAAPAQSLN